ncbi:hypothetical protein MW887_004747 [Aspergillus wentii]|nr:hypothetical protein MW887_004747 [Aspergillus wentii]
MRLSKSSSTTPRTPSTRSLLCDHRLREYAVVAVQEPWATTNPAPREPTFPAKLSNSSSSSSSSRPFIPLPATRPVCIMESAIATDAFGSESNPSTPSARDTFLRSFLHMSFVDQPAAGI